MLGIGLGGFADGLSDGVKTGDRLQDRMKERRQDAAMSEAFTEGRAEFEQDDPMGNWEQNWTRYVVPKAAAKMFAAGDDERGLDFHKWAKDENVEYGARLFASALRKGQIGDIEGALQDILESTRIPGYSPYKDITAKKTETGYRIKATTLDGREVEAEFKPEETLDFMAGWANPEAMHQQHYEAKAAAAKEQREVRTAGNKRRATNTADIEADNIRKNLSGGREDLSPSERRKVRADAIKRLDAKVEDVTEENIQKEIRLHLGPDYYDPADDEADPEILIDRQAGQPAAPSPARPGEAQAAPAPAGPAAPRPETAGLAPAAPRPEVQGPRQPLADRVAREGMRVGQDAAAAVGEIGQEMGRAGQEYRAEDQRRQQAIGQDARGQQQNDPARQQQVVERVVQLLARGTDPRAAIEILRRQGVPEEMWPPELRG